MNLFAVFRPSIERSLYGLVAVLLVAQLAAAAIVWRSTFAPPSRDERVTFWLRGLDDARNIREALSRLRPQGVELGNLPAAAEREADFTAIAEYAADLDDLLREHEVEPLRSMISRLRNGVLSISSAHRSNLPQRDQRLRDAFEDTRKAADELIAFRPGLADAPLGESDVGSRRSRIGMAVFETTAMLLLLAIVLIMVDSIRKNLRRRDRAEQILRRNEERLRRLLDVSCDMIFEFDLEGRYVYCDDQLSEGRRDGPDGFPGVASWVRVHPKDRDRVYEGFEEAVENDTATRSKFRILHRDGRTQWVEATSRPIRLPDGRIHIVTAGRDITADRAAMEKQLKLVQVVEATVDFVAVYDLDGRLSYLNPAGRNLIGVPLDADVSEICAWDFAPPGLEQSWWAMRSKYLAQGSWEVESKFRNLQTGELVPVYSVGRALWDESGEPIAMATVTRDLRLLKEAERRQERTRDQVSRSERLESLGLLAGGVAHDMNNLLTGVLINLNLARESTPRDSDLGACITRIEDAVRQLAMLSNQLLTYAGAEKADTEPVNLTALIVQTCALVGSSISERARLVFDMPPAIVARVNSAQIGQLIMNLIVNASESLGDESGEIAVTLKRVENARDGSWARDLPPSEGVLLEVADTGCGMSRQTQVRMFDPFYSTKSRSGRSRGFGLATALGIIRAHRGEIRVRSEIGRGTEMLVFLPGPEPAPNSVSLPRSSAPSVVRSSGRILVVDDEVCVRDSLAPLLRGRGFQVVCAPDGESAVDLMRGDGGQVDFALIDLSMPGMNGIETFKLLRQSRPALRGILCSGYPESRAMRQFSSVGFQAFLQKPYGIDQLLEAIAETSQ